MTIELLLSGQIYILLFVQPDKTPAVIQDIVQKGQYRQMTGTNMYKL